MWNHMIRDASNGQEKVMNAGHPSLTLCSKVSLNKWLKQTSFNFIAIGISGSLIFSNDGVMDSKPPPHKKSAPIEKCHMTEESIRESYYDAGSC